MNRGNLKDTHKRVKDGVPGDHAYVARMGEVYMFIEAKLSCDLDFFTDPPDIPDDETAGHRVSPLGQSTQYAHIVQTRQFRTCVYSISVAGSTARLLRWDRSGVIVTESFDYKSNPEILVGFVWRFSRATNEQRGFDCSAITVGSEAEREKFVDAIRGHLKEQLPGLGTEDAEREFARHHWPGAIKTLTIGSGAETHSILVSRPMFTSKGATGRVTIGYWGVESESGDVVFVKDVWLADVSGVEAEGAILERLSEAGVRNIPGLVCHGDVLHERKISCLRFM